MRTWLDKLHAGGIVVTDGATGTELRRRGAPWGDLTWSGLAGDARRDLLVRIHCDYIAAGAEIITANTFGTARFVLEAAGCGERFETINRAALESAREARENCGANVAIAASMSCLPPRFDPRAYPPPRKEQGAYKELADLFAAEGADFIALEMMQDARHAGWACAAARASGLPFWLGVSCRLDANGALVAFDYPEVSLEEILDALLPHEPSVVNVMHTPVEAVAAALRAVRAKWGGFIGAYPEIPEPAASAGIGPRALAEHAREWIALGARIVGGCCGTTPAHVRALAEAAAAAARLR